MTITPGRGGRKPRLLLVAYGYAYPSHVPPPTTRPHWLADELAATGYDVTVLTTAAGDLPTPARNGVTVVRAHDLITTRLNWRRGRVPSVNERLAADDHPTATRLSRLFVPDLTVLTWLPAARRAALAMAARDEVDCVLTSSPPHTVHLVGAALRRRDVPWVADLRDGWAFEPPIHRSGLLKHFDAGLERRTLSRADRLVAVTDAIAVDLRERLGVPAEGISNGCDPNEILAAESGEKDAATARLLDPERHSLVYTGRITAYRESTAALLGALRRWRREFPEEVERFELVLAGPLTREDRAFIEDEIRSGTVRYVEVLERPAALRLQRQADTLLLLSADDRPSVATAKLYDYLQAGRPIVAIGERSEGAAVVEASGAGAFVAAAEPDAMVAALRGLVNGRHDGFDPKRLAAAREQLTYPRLTERMAAVIEEARGERSR